MQKILEIVRGEADKTITRESLVERDPEKWKPYEIILFYLQTQPEYLSRLMAKHSDRPDGKNSVKYCDLCFPPPLFQLWTLEDSGLLTIHKLWVSFFFFSLGYKEQKLELRYNSSFCSLHPKWSQQQSDNFVPKICSGSILSHFSVLPDLLQRSVFPIYSYGTTGREMSLMALMLRNYLHLELKKVIDPFAFRHSHSRSILRILMKFVLFSQSFAISVLCSCTNPSNANFPNFSLRVH